jgi:predicted transcriptional regulator
MKLKSSKLLRRSRAAELIGVSSATLRRYERQGVLAAVKLNSRLTMYRECDVERIQQGRVETVPRPTPPAFIARAASGQFTPRRP